MKPESSPTIGGLISSATRREPLHDAVSQGYSGATLERLRFSDGRSVILKHLHPDSHVMMRFTADPGRAGLLWTEGICGRFPPEVDHTMIAAKRQGESWVIAMRDVSAALLSDESVISRSDSQRILEAVVSMHHRFAGAELAMLCDIPTAVRAFSPAVVGPHLNMTAQLARDAVEGWPIFASAVPAVVRDQVFAIHAQPQALARELEKAVLTLTHGDLWLVNIGLTQDKVILIDFDLATRAPGGFDFATYLLANLVKIRASREEIIEDWRRVSGASYDDRVQQLCYLAAFCEHGWLLAKDHAEGRHSQEELDWWIAAAARGLELLSSHG